MEKNKFLIFQFLLLFVFIFLPVFSSVKASSPHITAIGPITGTPQVGSTLTAGALSPGGASATYQWQSSATSGGTYANIVGANSSTYIPVTGDLGNYIQVVATGNGSYTGSINSVAVGPVIAAISVGPITGTLQAGSTLTAGDLSPVGSSATYQWQSIISQSFPNPGMCSNQGGITPLFVGLGSGSCGNSAEQHQILMF